MYGYVYASGGVRFPDGSIQTTSATQSSSGSSYGQWALGQASASVATYYQPIDTTQVAIGTDTPLAKLSIAKVNGEPASLPHLELRYTQNDYATMQVDANGCLIVTSRARPGLRHPAAAYGERGRQRKQRGGLTARQS